MNEQPKKHVTIEQERKIIEAYLARQRDSVFKRFPLIFTLLSTFGLVATFYGFEKIIDQIPFLNDNPAYILLTGLLILLGTGGLYKKLGD